MSCTSEKDSDDAKIKAVQVDAKMCTDLPQHTTSNLLRKFLTNMSAIVKDDISYYTVPGFRIKYNKIPLSKQV
jgi:hypothetical protein